MKFPINYKIAAILLTLLILLPTSTVEATLVTTPDKNNENIRYSVGNLYYDIWLRSDGVTWTSDGYKDEKNKKLPPFNYSFTHPGRKIKSVKIREFNPNENLPVELKTEPTTAQEVYKNARYGKRWREEKSPVSTNYGADLIGGSIKGYQTDTASFQVQVIGDLTAIVNPERVKGGSSNLDPNVRGERYYFPFLIIIELEPEGGKAIIKHFDKNGRSLNGIAGLRDKEEQLTAGRVYTPRHTNAIARYKYIGHKKSTTGPIPSGGSISSGDPPPLTSYKGDHDYYIHYYYEEEKDIPTLPDQKCVETRGRVIEKQVMDPQAKGSILADHVNNVPHAFDVTQGIPTSDHLVSQAAAKQYLFQHKFVQMNGECRFEVPVSQTFILTWVDMISGPNGTTIPSPQTLPDTRDESIEVVRKYSYWKIDNLEVYHIQQAEMKNYALPNGEILMLPKGYAPPVYAYSTSGKATVIPEPKPIQLPTVTVSGKSVPSYMSSFKQAAEASIKEVTVQNDALTFNNTLIMDSNAATPNGPTPGTIPDPAVIGPKVLYEDRLLIEPKKANRANNSSTGTIFYQAMNGIGGGGDKQFPISGINSTTVHTPVVNYSKLPDDNRPFDQRMKPDMTRTVLVLDRPFTIHFNEIGQHLSLPGYGNRDYRKYTKQKRVMFPFGVFQGSQYYHANRWITIPVGVPSMTFRMPTWVTEGNYQIRTESWAINEQGMDSARACEPNKNGNLANYCAYETFEVGVVGRLFGFRVWDIGDLRFEKVFRTQKGSKTHTGASYYSGGRDENGQPTNRLGKNSWILPIRQGSHPNERATVAHNGYPFLFDFKTIGNVWDKGEGIRIDPTFWYVSRKGGTPTQVDLYYDASGAANKMIRVGSSKDKQTYKRMYRLADPFRNMNQQELQKAASYEYNYILSSYERSTKPWSKFYNEFVKRSIQISNGYDIEILPYKSRTLIGPTSIPHGVDATEALRSVQHWYGEYHLPIAPYILPKGTDIVALANKYGGALDGHEKEFLKNGYIIVNFGIYTVKNNDIDTRVLGYKAPIANMWAIEGQIQSDSNYLGRTFTFQAGDIMMFESDFSVRNDFQGQGR